MNIYERFAGGAISVDKDTKLRDRAWKPATVNWCAGGMQTIPACEAFVRDLRMAISRARALDRKYPVGSKCEEAGT